MSKSRPTPLVATLISKGGARPMAELTSEADATLVPGTGVAMDAAPSEAGAVLASKAMTVKISASAYKKLKLHGLETGKTSQNILVDALDQYFRSHQL